MRVLKRKKVTAIEKKKIMKILEEFFQKDKRVLFAYLYGSFADGLEFNDIDVAVYFDEKQVERNKTFNLCLSLPREIEKLLGNRYEIDLHSLNLTPLSFRFAVITEGKLFVANNDDARVDFEVRTRDLYFDFQPHLEYYYRTAVLGENI